MKSDDEKRAMIRRKLASGELPRVLPLGDSLSVTFDGFAEMSAQQINEVCALVVRKIRHAATELQYAKAHPNYVPRW